jgi:hypothetical protein
VPVVDTWWQTGRSHPSISPLPGLTALPRIRRLVPGSGRRRRGGAAPRCRWAVRVLDDASVARDRAHVWGDPDRHVQYFSATVPGIRRGRRREATTRATTWLLGRIGDVMNVAGHRLSRSRSIGSWTATRWRRRPSSQAPRHQGGGDRRVRDVEDQLRGNDATLSELREHVAR